MKNFTLLLMMLLISSIAFSQAVFNWETHETGVSGNLKEMSINGSSAVIAGFNNNLFQTNDNGATWNSISMFIADNNIPDMSIEGSVGYIVTGREKLYDASPDVYLTGVILKTMDGGLTWTNLDLSGLGSGDDPALDPSFDLCYGYDFQAVETVNDSTAYCALRWYEYGGDEHSGIFMTTDSAKTWVNISGDLEGKHIKSIECNGKEVFIGGQKCLYSSALGNNTMTDIFVRMEGDGSDYVWDITVVDTNELYVTTNSDSIYFTNDGGATFDKFGGVKGGWDTYKVNDSTFVVGGSKDKTYVSTDNAQTWTSLGINTSIWEVPGMINDSLVLLAGQAIYKIAVSDLISGNYTFSIKEGGNGNLNAAHFAGDNAVIVGNDFSFIGSTDAGKTWINKDVPEIEAHNDFWDEVDFDALSNNGDSAYLCLNRIRFVKDLGPLESDIYWSGGVFYTYDNWAKVKVLDVAKLGNGDPTDPSKNPNHADCNGVNTSVIKYLGNVNKKDVLLLWARWYDYSGAERVEHSRVFKTVDTGKNWTAVTDDFGGSVVQDIDAVGDVVYVVGNKILLKSIDGGDNFTDLYSKVDPTGSYEAHFNALCLGDADELFMTTYSDSIWKSTDGGNTFTSFDGPTGSSDFYKFDSNSYMALGSKTKSFYTNDGGASWQNCAAPGTCYAIGGVLDGKFYGLSSKGKYYTLPVEDLDLQTGIATTLLSNKLSVLYGTRSITLTSNNTIDKCWVYNLSGQLMSIKVPNSNICEFNNSSFSSGVYIITSSVKGQKFTNKVVFK